LGDPSFAFPGPTWQLPDVPAEILVPFVGPAPQWWNWVPIHPTARVGGEANGGLHYVVEVTPTTMLSYYREALRQAGWEERMSSLEAGDYSFLSYDRYEDHATIYISPRDSGSLVSIIVE
jgi:hypothetical protein